MAIDPSPHLQEMATARVFEEIREVVRVFTVYHPKPYLQIRVTVLRIYAETTSHFSLSYERCDAHGIWSDADLGQVINGSDSEEQTIRVAIGFIRDVYQLH